MHKLSKFTFFIYRKVNLCLGNHTQIRIFINNLLCGTGSAQGATGLNPKAVAEAKEETSSQDGNLAFVAGATGRVGSRTVRLDNMLQFSPT